MTRWLLLAGAILTEVGGTLMLRAAVDNPWWVAGVVPSYLAAFALLALSLRAGLGIAAAYGIWGALGVALVALLATVAFGEHLSGTAVLGIAIIIAGVLLIETSPAPPATPDGAGAA